jgi:hypothetical protein
MSWLFFITNDVSRLKKRSGSLIPLRPVTAQPIGGGTIAIRATRRKPAWMVAADRDEGARRRALPALPMKTDGALLPGPY